MTLADAEPLRYGFLAGDVVLVTGAGRGIGEATARLAAEQGLRVAAWDLSQESAEATAGRIRSHGAEAVAVAADVSDPDQVRDGLDVTARMLGPVRYLVNCAGPSSLDPLAFDDAMRIGVGSMRLLTESWLAAPALSGRALVNVSSVAGNFQGANCDWYSAAKAAVSGYTRHLAACRADEVRSNAVAPGMTDTPRLHGTPGMADVVEEVGNAFLTSPVGQGALARVPLGRLATAAEVALPILFLLSPSASFVNGALLTIDGGWTLSV